MAPVVTRLLAACQQCGRSLALEYVPSPAARGERQVANVFECPHCAARCSLSLPGSIIDVQAGPSPADIVRAVRTWQRGRHGHLICERDASHGRLAAVVLDARVTLICPCCDHRQTYIPPAVLERSGLFAR